MGTRHRVRDIVESDLVSIVSIERQVFSMPWSPGAFLYEIRKNPHANLLAAEAHVESGWKLVGYIVYWLISGEAQIGNVAVAPAFQRQGIGRKLLEATLERMTAQGVLSATLDVRESNRAARELYRSFDFVDVGRRPGYYSRPKEDAILMTRFFPRSLEGHQ